MENRVTKKILIHMTAYFIWVFICAFISVSTLFAEKTEAQGMDDVKITVDYNGVTLANAIEDIEAKTDFNFLYSKPQVEAIPNYITIARTTATVREILQDISGQTGARFRQAGNNISVYCPVPEQVEIIKQQAFAHVIRGQVTDNKTGKPMVAVNVYIKGTTAGTSTNKQGRYLLVVPDNPQTILVFSFIGYETMEVKIGTQHIISIQLVPKTEALSKLVVTGIAPRDVETFTGAVSSYDGEELRIIGTKNIIESLKVLDPSFVVIENNQFGDDPNRLPQIELRGKTSISQEELRGEFGQNPNQPLFILDGFETDLQTIINLDMNRVKSVTVLKDAASTAMYGAKAANGVVVVETIDPEPGNLRVNYSANLSMTTPDLSVYNLMNAEEKLQFEKLSGLYDKNGLANHFKWDSLYYARLKKVRRGVNTYWLDVPTRRGITRDHSLYVQGGSSTMRYGVGLNYQHIEGTMKGSARKKWGVSLDLAYRKGALNISNKAYVRGFEANNSPYGSFMDFAQMSPYYRMRTADGEVTKYLSWDPTHPSKDIGNPFFSIMPNPLYNALLDSRDNTENLYIQNNLQAIWTIRDGLRLQAGLKVKKGRGTHIIFISPEHTMFDQKSTFEQGRYTEERTDDFSYQANIMLTYAQVWNQKHSFTGNLRADIQQIKNRLIGLTASGFPEGTKGNPAYSFGYLRDAKPSSGYRLYRRNSVLASMNYSYDQRYLIDATFRIDGSTAFGSSKPYSHFWAIGIGWNIHNETFLDNSAINTLRLRANIGTNGNQNFGSVTSVSVYAYSQGINMFGQGILLQSLGNPDLDWQKTINTSIGLDLVLFNNRLSVTLNAYQKYTDPLMIVINLGSSTGIYGHQVNAGHLNTRGLEANIRFSPIYNLTDRIIWTIGVTGRMIKSKYGGFGNRLNSLNKQQLNNSSLYRYIDGHSPTDIWTVRSLGINPITGQELFLSANGDYTFDYNTDDIAVVGNTRPVIAGIISSSLTYKNFQLSIALRYSYGGDILNRVLYNKVENISSADIIYNHDRRALTGRWKTPGEFARFKGISSSNYTPISSRFIQEENYIVGESIRLGYRVDDSEWLTNLGIESLRISGYLNDIFRLSTIKRERGIQYPFARSISSSISISF